MSEQADSKVSSVTRRYKNCWQLGQGTNINKQNGGETRKFVNKNFRKLCGNIYGRDVTLDFKTNLVELIYARISVCAFWWQAG